MMTELQWYVLFSSILNTNPVFIFNEDHSERLAQYIAERVVVLLEKGTPDVDMPEQVFRFKEDPREGSVVETKTGESWGVLVRQIDASQARVDLYNKGLVTLNIADLVVRLRPLEHQEALWVTRIVDAMSVE